MKNLNKILIVVSGLLFGACLDGGYEHPIVQDTIPAVPVLFPGATTFGANPYYTVSLAGNNFAINISVPAGTRTIKEVTKVIAGATGITPGNVTTAGVANYLAAPLAVNGTEVSISTSITEFNSKVAAAARVTAASIPAGSYAERAFMFLITLDDDTTIIPQQCRIRVIP